jgi:hypothetical protein
LCGRPEALAVAQTPANQSQRCQPCEGQPNGKPAARQLIFWPCASLPNRCPMTRDISSV